MLTRISLLLIILISPAVSYASEVLELRWKDLIPEDEVARYELYMQAQSASLALLDHTDDSLKMNQITFGTARSDLNQKTVSIPGFIIPLEGDDKTLTEFMLVPFVGACIHVPPPPPNQIIYVISEEGVNMEDLWTGVTVEGTISTESVDNDLASIGYQMKLDKIEKF
ncbi:hypothetical protein VFDL14_21565 [Vibrio fortis]|uniref:DUF3299 domain-containing protein n=1 Tax=Vibrio fortis TaxID=212667 RepID=A0A066UTK2_9VIBR|nr:DUF3299 domain-containing protein [Vibrio fortis]KDN27469.1 hypothetical protein VFDL14_21565 [Vibrio fortis]